ncbi:dienelactone hydrolase family protein [Curvibacter sp. HBC28]|uniref:Dienelactone hydrolase family protein n=1 Tax=Curvibacter microcysteis TaxID=3026419 RepID=A0ABT5MKB3_9BURK|nr:dienelactone hydrolase family protein [Curvibacter sp. HBC28]MDD0816999.1 dienelactone hydrolase family protein [Curvibacter sp. HBC28]
MGNRLLFARFLALGWLLGAALAQAQTAASPSTEPALAADLRESVQHVPVRVKDLYGREESRDIPVTVFRPQGAGPFPLVIFNHGRAVSAKRAQQGRQRYEHIARYLVHKGFVVMVPTRVGYGETYGDFDPESSGNCNAMRVEPMAQAASDQVLATWAWARSQPGVDASRWLVMGQSVGGLTAVATVARQPEGLLGGINWSGGTGGDPDQRTGNPCGPQVIQALWRRQSAPERAPMLWLYWENDRYWGAEHPRRWFQAWREGGAPAEFQQLGASGSDGHSGATADMDHWVPRVDAFLAQLGFKQPGLPALPPAQPTGAVTDLERVPVSDSTRANFYQKFLASPLPRAFAISPSGAVGWATGDWAVGRALGFCQARRGEVCKLYAVDNTLVWAP